MKAYIAVAVAAIVGTLILVVGIGGIVYSLSQPQHSETYSAFQDLWDQDISEDSKVEVCDSYYLTPRSSVNNLVESARVNGIKLSREEAETFFDNNCS